MKRLLISVFALLIAAPAVQADSVWLIMKEAVSMYAIDVEKLEMSDMNQCEEQGAIFMSSERMGAKRGKYSGFECLEGK